MTKISCLKFLYYITGFCNCYGNGSSRSKLLVCVLSSIMVPLLLVKYHYDSLTEYSFYWRHYDWKIARNTCLIPEIDPWDQTIVKYINTSWPPIECGQTQPYLTYRDYAGVLKFNESETELILDELNVTCWYRVFKRTGENDDNLTYSEEVEFLNQNIPETSEFLSVRCDNYSGDSAKPMYSNLHFHIPNDHVITPERNNGISYNKSLPRPNVIILATDSMSLPNYKRQMKRTYKYLTERIRGYVLNGHMTCGDNTFTNIIPMLTGRRPFVEGVSEYKELPGDPIRDFFDPYPMVWKDFNRAGYLTSFAEDSPGGAIFNYNTKGFKKKPTDFYMRPFWLEMYKSELLKQSSNLCFGNFPRHRYLLDWAREVIDKYHGKIPIFSFNFLTELSHDYLNQIHVVDSEFEAYFEDLHQRGKLENTILIVMGDHGNRYDRFRSTIIGRMEEHMPFLFIHLPEKLEKQFPNLKTKLEENSEKMTTWFDMYELLADVAAQNWGPQSDSRWGIRGYSPFRSIPVRTCEEAGISEQYCTCLGTKVLDVSDWRVVSAANDLVENINTFLVPVQPPCSVLTLNAILNGEQVLPQNSGFAPRIGFKLVIRVTIEVLPSYGTFEGTLSLNARQSSFQVVDDISRTNRYGNQSHCIKSKRLEKYCYCLQQ